MTNDQPNQVRILLLAPSAGIGSFFRPESRTGFSRDRWAVPPLGLHRIKSYLKQYGIDVDIFDSYINTEEFLISQIRGKSYTIIGFSITHQTLENDIYFMHLCKRISPSSILIIGGDEATFNYPLVMNIAPIDYAVLGEGEKPLREICLCLKNGSVDFSKIPGLVYRSDGQYRLTGPNYAMNHEEFEKATFSINYTEIPYERYWEKIESFYKTPNLNETRTIRLFTANYCPRKCTFCSSTNFLDAAGGSHNRPKTTVVALSGESLFKNLLKAIENHPSVRNIFINDDDFVFQKKRVNEFCDMVYEHKKSGRIPDYLTFMCLSRTDDLDRETLEKMSRASFRLIGYGVESFSQQILTDLNKRITVDQIHRAISSTLEFNIVPYLNIIIFPPSAVLRDVLVTIENSLSYIEKGLEVAVEPFMIPLAGATITNEGYDILSENIPIAGTDKVLKLPTVILPRDEEVRNLVMNFEGQYDLCLKALTERFKIRHIPARFRSLVSFHAVYSLLGSGYESQLTRIENIINTQFSFARFEESD